MTTFEAWSPWVAAPDPLHAPLSGARRADEVIIGGGYVRLNTALNLR